MFHFLIMLNKTTRQLNTYIVKKEKIKIQNEEKYIYIKKEQNCLLLKKCDNL